jgi:hypothetical protein
MRVPNVSHVALLVNPADKTNSQTYIQEAEAAAKKLGVTLYSVEVHARRPLIAAQLP